MREIIFRGKRTDNGEWVEGSLLKVTIDGKTAHLIFGDNFCFVGNDVKAMSHALVDPDTVGQYTGLKDKNGKRIFEGDVVLFKWDKNCDYCHTIAFEDGEFLAIPNLDLEDAWPFRISGETQKFCIIGNIHDGLIGGNDG